MKGLSCAFVVGLVGLFCLLIGIGLGWFGVKSLLRMFAWEKLTLKNDSEAMTRWIRPSQPISMKVYIFNVTNPEDVSDGALPILSEIGPYVYEQFREKVNIVQLENYTLSYRLRNTIKFKQNLSGRLKESDLVTIFNVPLAGAILSVYEAVPEFVGILNDIWRFFFPGQNNIFITTTVRDILFDGITIDCTSKITEVYIACRGLDSRESYSVRKEGKNFKFSFFHAKNGTSQETYQVNQGIFDFKKSAQYIGINYSPTINIWKNYYCDMINGSDGAQFPVLLDKTEKLYIFEKELCRSVYVEFEKEIIKNGVVLYKYSNTASLFASPKENPDNWCFCRSPMNLRDLVEVEQESKTENMYCNANMSYHNGILPLMPCVGRRDLLSSKYNVPYFSIRNLSDATLGAPIVASFPHFYLGDQTYINYSGLNPVKQSHETFIYAEPISGITVFGLKRLQLNLEVKRIFDVQIMSNLIDGIFPLLWVEEGMELSPELFKLLRYSLTEKKILENSTFFLSGIGVILIIVAFIVSFIAEKSTCCKGSNLEKRELAEVDGSKAYEEIIRNRLTIWKNSKNVVNPNEVVTPRKSTFNEVQTKFLIDNFMQ